MHRPSAHKPSPRRLGSQSKRSKGYVFEELERELPVADSLRFASSGRTKRKSMPPSSLRFDALSPSRSAGNTLVGSPSAPRSPGDKMTSKERVKVLKDRVTLLENEKQKLSRGQKVWEGTLEYTEKLEKRVSDLRKKNATFQDHEIQLIQALLDESHAMETAYKSQIRKLRDMMHVSEASRTLDVAQGSKAVQTEEDLLEHGKSVVEGLRAKRMGEDLEAVQKEFQQSSTELAARTSDLLRLQKLFEEEQRRNAEESAKLHSMFSSRVESLELELDERNRKVRDLEAKLRHLTNEKVQLEYVLQRSKAEIESLRSQQEESIHAADHVLRLQEEVVLLRRENDRFRAAAH
eukprot:TRINITY_DN2235_c2_g1_i1.p1 TRINITY_DN2235_c2_g1~~TRINITY_DN2235_c2_g1_i1.p1  ORF type:complete len:349 (+),score=96.86 TRINITY_DN2235_c2_g1_i1:105-1151(+)